MIKTLTKEDLEQSTTPPAVKGDRVIRSTREKPFDLPHNLVWKRNPRWPAHQGYWSYDIPGYRYGVLREGDQIEHFDTPYENDSTKWIVVFDQAVIGSFHKTLLAALTAAGRAAKPVSGNWERIRVFPRRFMDPKLFDRSQPILDLHRDPATKEFA